MANTSFNGSPVKCTGRFVGKGDNAPSFTLIRNDLSTLSLRELHGKKVLLNIFPSLDTSVCANSVRAFNKLAASHSGTVVLAISKDLPFAHGRFCTTEGIGNLITLSDFRDNKFGSHYGVLMEDGPLAGLLARAVVVIDESGVVIYSELVPNIAQEPNYDEAIKWL